MGGGSSDTQTLFAAYEMLQRLPPPHLFLIHHVSFVDELARMHAHRRIYPLICCFIIL